MASMEFIQERITKAQETITKKQNTITKKEKTIEKKIITLDTKFHFTWKGTRQTINELKEMGYAQEPAFDIYWLECDIENLIDDIHRLQKEVSEKEASLKKYEEELQVLIEKANSRNIKVIIDFLEMWKEEVKKFYERNLDKWVETLLKYYEEDRKFTEWSNSHFHERKDKELVKEMRKPKDEAKAIHSMYSFLDRYVERRMFGEYVLNMELLQKDLDEDANQKYDFIIERTNEIVGQITDASNLSIGHKGDLNGFIIGTRGTAKVQTIGAGGYNIQCYHFRTLINKMN